MIKKIYAIEKKRIVDVFIFISISTYLAHYILKYHLGYLENYWLFFHDQTDHFADTLKIIFSFTNIFTERATCLGLRSICLIYLSAISMILGSPISVMVSNLESVVPTKPIRGPWDAP